jgi:hypothetical protein
MEHGRNPHGLTDLSKAWATIDLCRLRCQKSCLSAGNGRTPGSKNDNIMLDQFFTNCDMPLIQRGSGVVSPNHAGYTPYAAVDDIIIKGII